jgi:hypothetical protein
MEAFIFMLNSEKSNFSQNVSLFGSEIDWVSLLRSTNEWVLLLGSKNDRSMFWWSKMCFCRY